MFNNNIILCCYVFYSVVLTKLIINILISGVRYHIIDTHIGTTYTIHNMHILTAAIGNRECIINHIHAFRPFFLPSHRTNLMFTPGKK